MKAQLELGLDQLLARRRAQLLEAGDLDHRERLECQVGQRRSAPQSERLVQKLRADLGSPSFGGLRDEPLEPVQIDLIGGDVEHVAGRASANEVATEQLAQA